MKPTLALLMALRLTFAAVASLLLPVGLAVAQERGFDPLAIAKQVELETRFRELYQEGKYAEAIPLGEELVSLTERLSGPEDLSVATILNNLAELYQSQGEYAKAEPLYNRSLAIRETTLGPDHPDVATSLGNLAKLYRSMKRDAEAKPLEERAARIRAMKR